MRAKVFASWILTIAGLLLVINSITRAQSLQSGAVAHGSLTVVSEAVVGVIITGVGTVLLSYVKAREANGLGDSSKAKAMEILGKVKTEGK